MTEIIWKYRSFVETPFIKTSKSKLMLFRLFSIPNAYCPGMDLKLSIKKNDCSDNE